MEWDFDQDLVTITSRKKTHSPEALIKVVLGSGFRSSQVASAGAKKATSQARRQAPVPESAPAYFKEALARAKASGKPVIIDFWATWCAPCVRLKRETLQDPTVLPTLSAFEVIYVDLDQHPTLAAAYSVRSIPDVFIVDADGWIVDRLRNFEGAKAFLARLQRSLTPERKKAP